MNFGAAVSILILLFAAETAALYRLRQNRKLLGITVLCGAVLGFLMHRLLGECYRNILPSGANIDIGSILISWVYWGLYIAAAPVAAFLFYSKGRS